jgi:hypothetical protein
VAQYDPRDWMHKHDLGPKAIEFAGTTSMRSPTLRENIGADLARARANVARLEELAKLIDENPHTSRIPELMSQR